MRFILGLAILSSIFVGCSSSVGGDENSSIKVAGADWRVGTNVTTNIQFKIAKTERSTKFIGLPADEYLVKISHLEVNGSWSSIKLPPHNAETISLQTLNQIHKDRSLTYIFADTYKIDVYGYRDGFLVSQKENTRFIINDELRDIVSITLYTVNSNIFQPVVSDIDVMEYSFGDEVSYKFHFNLELPYVEDNLSFNYAIYREDSSTSIFKGDISNPTNSVKVISGYVDDIFGEKNSTIFSLKLFSNRDDYVQFTEFFGVEKNELDSSRVEILESIDLNCNTEIVLNLNSNFDITNITWESENGIYFEVSENQRSIVIDENIFSENFSVSIDYSLNGVDYQKVYYITSAEISCTE
jgi:hypothetical protein